jgi:hypothetical protein
VDENGDIVHAIALEIFNEKDLQRRETTKADVFMLAKQKFCLADDAKEQIRRDSEGERKVTAQQRAHQRSSRISGKMTKFKKDVNDTLTRLASGASVSCTNYQLL